MIEGILRSPGICGPISREDSANFWTRYRLPEPTDLSFSGSIAARIMPQTAPIKPFGTISPKPGVSKIIKTAYLGIGICKLSRAIERVLYWESAMSFALSDEEHLMLELIADRPVPAVPEIQRYTAPLAATKLIALTNEIEWQITPLGKAMLERTEQRLH